MSSFVIKKELYVKAAGLVAGIAEVKNVWVYDYKARRPFDKKLYYNAFVECYEMNALSVQEQYKDPEPEADPNDYIKEFNAAYICGRDTAILYPERLKNAIMDLREFFSCAMYQTEKDAYYFKMQMLFDRILVQLMEYLTTPPERNGWNFETLETI